MRTVAVGLTAITLALAVVSCADGCSARKAANSATDPASATPASDSGSATPPSPQSGPGAPSTEPVPTMPEGEVPAVEPLPSTKPQPEPPTIEGMKSASTDGPPLDDMQLARASGKLGPPVDVRYQLSGSATKYQPVTLQLAFVPRLDGSNLRVEFPDTDGVAIETGSKKIASQKASKSDVLRHALLVTPTAADSGEVRAYVSIDVGSAKYAGIVSIPIGERSQKVASKKVPQG
jgi:hypothetical protein